MMRTTAIELAREKGWSLADLAQKSGLSLRMVYYLADGGRGVGPQAIAALMRTFPEVPFERLFVPADSAEVQSSDTIKEGAAA